MAVNWCLWPSKPTHEIGFLGIYAPHRGFFDGPWFLAGDFNALLEQKDKLGGIPFSSGSVCKFRKLVDDLGLTDLGFVGYPYTWTNRRASRANIQERLDRGFANSSWRLLYPEASIHHLTAYHSDHRPILLLTDSLHSSSPKPFRFESMWLREPSVGLVISQAWRKGVSLPTISQLMTHIKYTKVALKDWNRKYFGHVQSRIVELKNVIDSIQQMPTSERTLLHEDLAVHELDEMLRRERILWQDKAKTKWLLEGDANTRYFHLTTLAHQKHNRIYYIFDPQAGRISNPDKIGQLFVDFYRDLFQTGPHCFPLHMDHLFFSSIDDEANSTLLSIPERPEIQSILASMNEHKSPGSDGMSPSFYTHFWNITGLMSLLLFVVSSKVLRLVELLITLF